MSDARSPEELLVAFAIRLRPRIKMMRLKNSSATDIETFAANALRAVGIEPTEESLAVFLRTTAE